MRALLDSAEFDAGLRALNPRPHVYPFPPFERTRSALPRLEPRLRVLVALLVLGIEVDAAEAEAELGADHLDALERLGLLQRTARQIAGGKLAVVRHASLYVACSRPASYPTRFDAVDAVGAVFLGPSSCALTLNLPAPLPGAALDVCAGPAIHAMILAAGSSRVVAIEIDSSSLAAAALSLELNGLAGRVELRQGNLYDPVAGERFNTIVCNPPFVACPDDLGGALYAAGGPDGLRVVGPLLAGLPDHLADAGAAHFYLEALGDGRRPFLAGFLEELAGRGRLDLRLVLLSRSSIGALLLDRALDAAAGPSHGKRLPRWKEFYEEQGATHFYQAMVRAWPGGGRLHVVDLTRA